MAELKLDKSLWTDKTKFAGEDIEKLFIKWASELKLKVTDIAFAQALNNLDPLRHLRERFHYPTLKDLPHVDAEVCEDIDSDSMYLCGNSLGLMPKGVRQYIDTELDKWAKSGVYGHLDGSLPWALCDVPSSTASAKIVGAKSEEVVIMNGLSVNIHLLMISFYRPTATRHKILIESKAFPSDHYIIQSQVEMHGFNPEESMICLKPRAGEQYLRKDDILAKIADEGDSIALVFFSGVQYYTGQLFDIPAITERAHQKGCVVGFDLAHAVGNVPLELHAWGVDFAAWCTYKYLNSGAGCIAGAFVHEKHFEHTWPRLSGWWGHEWETRFKMDNVLKLSAGASSYRLSNPPPLLCCCLLASLDVFQLTDVRALWNKAALLTTYLEILLRHEFPSSPASGDDLWVDVMTPRDTTQRGAQLSILLSLPIKPVHEWLHKLGAVCDEREPNVLRVAPAPLYNNFTDVFRFVRTLRKAMTLARREVAAS